MKWNAVHVPVFSKFVFKIAENINVNFSLFYLKIEFEESFQTFAINIFRYWMFIYSWFSRVKNCLFFIFPAFLFITDCFSCTDRFIDSTVTQN